MCAILFTDSEKIDYNRFSRALSLMRHRGPESTQIFESINIKMGHNRLKILDLDDHANQPFVSSDNRYVMIYNGEIYNYKELAKKYDIHTKTSSDTEVLIELYLKLGNKMLSELNGMFAFIILDKFTNNIFVARDRLGVKPLYYALENNHFIFSSEIAPIVNLLDNVEFDEVGVRQYLKMRTFFNGHTIYKNISMMGAGTYFENGTFHTYWEFPNVENEPPKDEELFELVKSAVDYRCISDVPVGCYLSGGIDSSIISGLAHRTHTWTVGYADNNEFNWSQMVSAFQHVEHHKTILEYKDFLPTLKELITKRKEPLSVPNELLLYEMTKDVKKKNTVVLSGEGADELMFGYDRIFQWAHQNKWDISSFDKLYSYGSHSDNEILDYAIEPFKKYGTNINVIAAFFQVAHLHGLLRRLDFSTMQSSVEARVPFVDHRLVERMAGVPFEYRMKDGRSKEPLKRLFANYLPQEVLGREKVGFPVKLENIFTNGTQSQMDSWLHSNLEILKEVMQ